MDHVSLNLSLGLDCAGCFLKALKLVHTEEQHIFHASVFQIIEHPNQNLLVSFVPTVMLRMSL